MKLTQPTNRPNFHALQTDIGTVYFSYETPIALIRPGHFTFVSNNEWRQTTGKHINYIKEHESNCIQVSHDELMKQLNRLQGGNNENDNRYSNNLTEPGLFERLS